MPERHVEAIAAAEAGGYSVLIIDSYSHEWTDPGSYLETNKKLATRSSKTIPERLGTKPRLDTGNSPTRS
jgi:hypothetical protein